MKKVILFIISICFNVASFSQQSLIGQQSFIDYVMLKPQTAITLKQKNSYAKLINKGIIPGLLYPIVKRNAASYTILVMYLTDQANISVDSSYFILLKKLPKKERKQKLLQLLDESMNGFEKFSSQSLWDSTILLDGSPVSYGYAAIDSIYENVYSNNREEITRFWYEYKDAEVLSKWLKFVSIYGHGEDGLDRRFLVYCYFKHPKSFIEVVNNQTKEIKDSTVFYMSDTLGFQYAAFFLKLDYKKEIEKFMDMFK